VAFVWLATGLGLLHPYYRTVGEQALAPLGLPPWVMAATCVGEVALGLRVALGRAATWLTALQAAMIAVFTALLTVTQPVLWLHPFGLLSKNVPLLAMIAAAWRVERRGWDAVARWALLCGLAAYWVADGAAALALYGLAPAELNDLQNRFGFPAPPALRVAGALGAASGVTLLLLRGWARQALLACQMLVLAAVPAAMTWFDPLLWFHPFGPLTKNVALLVATGVVLRRAAVGKMTRGETP
jgi:hypothetical protein